MSLVAPEMPKGRQRITPAAPGAPKKPPMPAMFADVPKGPPPDRLQQCFFCRAYLDQDDMDFVSREWICSTDRDACVRRVRALRMEA